MSSSTKMAIALSSPLILPLLLFGGFFINNRCVIILQYSLSIFNYACFSSIPVYFEVFKYISWFYYGNEALVISQWKSIEHISCPESTVNSSPNATQSLLVEHRCLTKGISVIEELSFNPNNILFDICLLVILIFTMRLLAFLALLRKSKRR